VRFLSPEWIAAFNDAVGARRVEAPGPDAGLAARDGSFTVGQVVSGGPDGEVRTTLRVHDGTVAMTMGAADDVDVMIRLAWPDAVDLASGALRAGDAIASGRVQVRGDLSVLGAGQSALVALHAPLSDLHDATEF